ENASRGHFRCKFKPKGCAYRNDARAAGDVVRVHGASFLKVSLSEGRVMAQEQAKTPPAGTAAGGAGDNPFDIKGTSAGDIREGSSAALDQPFGSEGQQKPSLAERLRAEQQRKTPEPKMDETKTADLG